MPLTTPVATLTEAMPGEELDQVPPAEADISVVVPLAQIVVVPVIGDGVGNTVTGVPAVQPEGSV